MNLTQGNQTIEWLGVRFRVPGEWQIVRHSVVAEKGSLSLVDRRRQRLQLLWSDWAVKPDVGRLIGDYRSQASERDADATFETLDLPEPWLGVGRHVDRGEMLVRAARFDAATHRLIEAALLLKRDAPADRELLLDVLDSVEVVDRPEVAQRWEAFDLALFLPPGLRLRQAEVKPMDVALRFRGYDADADKYDRREVRVRRMGMADAWFKDAERMLKKADWKLEYDLHYPQHNGHPAVLGVCQELGKGWQRWRGKLRRRRDLVWQCPTENAVYQVTTFSPVDQDVEPDALDVSCCRELVR
ncbi:MAG: hypothetical protein WD118_11525 [Phycisphaeraceae bacterium]